MVKRAEPSCSPGLFLNLWDDEWPIRNYVLEDRTIKHLGMAGHLPDSITNKTTAIVIFYLKISYPFKAPKSGRL
jgi:hypothetical protein